MSARFGRVLYWACNAVAVLWACLMVFELSRGSAAREGQILLAVAFVPVLLIWLIGRVLYVLTGR